MSQDIDGEARTRKSGEIAELIGEGAEVEDSFGGEDDRLVVVVGAEGRSESGKVGAGDGNNDDFGSLKCGGWDGIFHKWIIETN